MEKLAELIKSARDYQGRGKFSQAIGLYQRALKKARSKEKAKIKKDLAFCYLRSGELDLALKEAREAEDSFAQLGDEIELAKARLLVANVLLEMGKSEEARDLSLKVYESYKRTEHSRLVGLSQRFLGRAFAQLGDYGQAKDYLQDSLSTFRRADDEGETLNSYNDLAFWGMATGDWGMALENLEKGLAISKRVRRKREEGAILNNIGTVYRKTGKWVKAEDYLNRSLEIKKRMGDPIPLAHGYISLGRLKALQRQPAEDLLKRALTLAQEHGYRREEAMSLESLGDVAKENGDLDLARDYYQRTLDIGRKLGQKDIINQVQRRRADLLIAEGKDLDEASRCIQEALRVSQSLGDRFEEGCCYRTMGRLAQAKGDSKAAEANFEKSVCVLRSLEDRFELAHTLLAQGELRGELDLLREAQRLFAQIQGAEFYQALALLQIARAEPSFKKAIETLEGAEKLLRAKGEAEKLKEVRALKLELNQRLERFPSRKYEFLQGLSSGDLGEVFGQVIEVLGADRGFVAYTGDGSKGMEVGASHNLGEGEVNGLLSLLADGPVCADRDGFEVGRPSILYDSSLDERFSAVGAGSLMLIPYGSRERIDGYLYVDRQRGKEPFLEKELDLFYLLSERVAKAIVAQRQRELEKANLSLRQRLAVQGVVPEEIITQNEKMLKVLKEADKVKDSKATVLIQGESGTGKELVARKIHFASQRNTNKLIPINCGAIPNDLFEAEVFGCERGAFTGAVPRKGLIEEANGGTLFLDEVGNLSLGHQAKLLRVLEEGKVRRVGGNEERSIDVRVIAATNKDLAEEIRKGRFREDLYYRLKQIVLDLPPLRERRDDIRLLAHHFLGIYSYQFKKSLRGISEEALRLLEGYHWPGNVRELKNEMERAVLMAEEGDQITPEHLSEGMRLKGHLEEGSLQALDGISLEEAERVHILRVLEQTGWKKVEACSVLGISRPTLNRKMEKYHIEGRRSAR